MTQCRRAVSASTSVHGNSEFCVPQVSCRGIHFGSKILLGLGHDGSIDPQLYPFVTLIYSYSYSTLVIGLQSCNDDDSPKHASNESMIA